MSRRKLNFKRMVELALIFNALLANTATAQIDTFRFYLRYEIPTPQNSEYFFDSMMWQRNQMRIYCPVYVLQYDTLNRIRCEFTACGDCNVGYYKEFWRNGAIRLQGSYMDIANVSRKNFDHSICNLLDGEQMFYDSNGNLEYSEKWKGGKFLKQFPLQKNCEIWDMKVLIDGKQQDTCLLSQLPSIRIIESYKNDNDSIKLIKTIEVTRLEPNGTGTGLYESSKFVDDKIPIDAIDSIQSLSQENEGNFWRIGITGITVEPYGFQSEIVVIVD